MAKCIPRKYFETTPAIHNIHKFIEGLNIPQLNVEEQESPEKDLTFEELKDALTCRQLITSREKMDSQKNSMKHSLNPFAKYT